MTEPTRYYEIGIAIHEWGEPIRDHVEYVATDIEPHELEDNLRRRGDDVNYVQELTADEYLARR